MRRSPSRNCCASTTDRTIPLSDKSPVFEANGLSFPFHWLLKSLVCWILPRFVKNPLPMGAPKTCEYVIINASRGYLFRKTHESILGAPEIHPWLPRFSEQTTSFRLQVPTHIWCTPPGRKKGPTGFEFRVTVCHRFRLYGCWHLADSDNLEHGSEV